MDTAKGPPKESGKLVTMMKAGPRCLGINSLAASEADVEDAGYSPPAPVNIGVKIDFRMECLALQEQTESHDASCHSHHPEHTVNGHSIGGSCEDATDDNHDSREDNSHISAQVVAGQTIHKLDTAPQPSGSIWVLPDHNLADDFANQQRIGHTRTDGGGVLLGILCLEKHIDHGHQVILVSIADQSKATGELNQVVR